MIWKCVAASPKARSKRGSDWPPPEPPTFGYAPPAWVALLQRLLRVRYPTLRKSLLWHFHPEIPSRRRWRSYSRDSPLNTWLRGSACPFSIVQGPHAIFRCSPRWCRVRNALYFLKLCDGTVFPPARPKHSSIPHASLLHGTCYPFDSSLPPSLAFLVSPIKENIHFDMRQGGRKESPVGNCKRSTSLCSLKLAHFYSARQRELTPVSTQSIRLFEIRPGRTSASSALLAILPTFPLGA